MKVALGLLLAFAVGVVCSLAGLPLPAPLALTGAALVLAMSAGYEIMDRLAPGHAASQRGNYGGSDGETADARVASRTQGSGPYPELPAAHPKHGP